MRLGAMLFGLYLAAAAPPPAQDQPREEILWTCPTHREETGAEGGVCSQCGQLLIRSRARVAWSCPKHAVVVESEPGECPLCGSKLYPISQEIAYVCPMHPEVTAIEPGVCRICRMALVSSFSTRPHQDHNPKHGGIFFMAPDAWHHLEGTYPEDGTFRVYLFDNFSRPLSAKDFRGRAVLKESVDPATRELREIVSYPLLSSREGDYLEAFVGSGPLPREITARIQFEREGPFERFDFVFGSLTSSSELDVSSESSFVVPDSPEEIAAAILERNDRVRDLLAKGALTEIFVPALEAKDLALALESRGAASADGASLAWALKELVRTAWLLDDYGDLGNRAQVESAYRPFDEAARTIAAQLGVAR